MTRHEKLILLLVALLVLTRVGFLAREILIAYHYGTGPIPLGDKELWKLAHVAIRGLVNVGAAIWLFVESRAAALRTWVWSLFGLCFGLFGVALFYLVQLYTRHRVQAT